MLCSFQVYSKVVGSVNGGFQVLLNAMEWDQGGFQHHFSQGLKATANTSWGR